MAVIDAATLRRQVSTSHVSMTRLHCLHGASLYWNVLRMKRLFCSTADHQAEPEAPAPRGGE